MIDWVGRALDPLSGAAGAPVQAVIATAPINVAASRITRAPLIAMTSLSTTASPSAG